MDCKRMVTLLNALKVEYETVLVDSPETREFYELINNGDKALPTCFVGEKLIGDFDALETLNEEGFLPMELRKAGYSGKVHGGDNIPVGGIVAPAAASAAAPAKKVIVKKVIIKKKKAYFNGICRY